VAVVLGLASAAATLAVFPYLQLLIPEQLARLPARLWVVALAQSAQSGLLCTLLAWLGLTVGAPYGLDAPWIRAWTERSPSVPAIRPRWLLAVLVARSLGFSWPVSRSCGPNRAAPPQRATPSAGCGVAPWPRSTERSSRRWRAGCCWSASSSGFWRA